MDLGVAQFLGLDAIHLILTQHDITCIECRRNIKFLCLEKPKTGQNHGLVRIWV